MVVGIDHYEQPGWNVEGPVMAAQVVVGWLLELTGVDLELNVFLSEGAVLDAHLQEQYDQGRFRLHRNTNKDTLDRFIRRDLPIGVEPDTHLFVYWSGHGGTCSTLNHRLFVCSDCCDELPNRYLDATNFRRLLRTPRYSAFCSQIILADVCGTFEPRSQLELENFVEQDNIPQLAYFAAPEGSYAESMAAGGVFTPTVLQVLRAAGGYPKDLNRLAPALEHAFDAISAARLRIAAWRDQDQSEIVVGASRRADAAGPPFLASALALLQELDIVERIYRVHYERTMADLGIPPQPSGTELRDILIELCTLRDPEPGHMTFGLIQFMMRLAEQFDFADPIGNWLESQAPHRLRSRQAVRDLLVSENLVRALLIVVREERGEIVSMRPYLCRADGSLAAQSPFESKETPCHGWDEFVAAVQAVLAGFVVDGMLPNLQIQFAVDTNLLDRPFHQIPVSPGGDLLGRMCVVVLRHRPRLLTPDMRWKSKWAQYADTLRSQSPEELRWIQIDTSRPLPLEKAMCFTGFVLPHPAPSAASRETEKRAIQRLLLLGSPVLYVRYAAPEDGRWERVSTWLESLTSSLPHFEAFVDTFQDVRTSGSDDGEQAGLLWDDPRSNPFAPIVGANDPS
jgi:hypothetical protein